MAEGALSNGCVGCGGVKTAAMALQIEELLLRIAGAAFHFSGFAIQRWGVERTNSFSFSSSCHDCVGVCSRTTRQLFVDTIEDYLIGGKKGENP